MCIKCTRKARLPKALTQRRVCRHCNNIFQAADSKASLCSGCRKLLATCPSCGAKKDVTAKLCFTCHTKLNSFKGKSYENIYGKDKADQLRALRREQTTRMNAEGILHAPAKIIINGKSFLAKQEYEFYCFLRQEGFEDSKIFREYPFPWYDEGGKLHHKIVDFFLPDLNTAIELTEYIWGRGDIEAQDSFVSRILSVASSNASITWLIATKTKKILSQIENAFLGFFPWNFAKMTVGTNLKVLEMDQLCDFIKKRGLI